jgi:hypothetical protein
MIDVIKDVEELESIKRLLITLTERVSDKIQEKENLIAEFEEDYEPPF